jgi:hypothetical protein
MPGTMSGAVAAPGVYRITTRNGGAPRLARGT